MAPSLELDFPWPLGSLLPCLSFLSQKLETAGAFRFGLVRWTDVSDLLSFSLPEPLPLYLVMLLASPLPAPISAHPVTRELGGLDPIWPRQGGLQNEQFFCPSPFPVL